VLPEEIKNKQELYEKLKKGTTTVGIVCMDGVVLATDRRVTAGTYIAHKRGRKLFVLDENKAATIAGLVADAQMIMDFLKSQINLMKLTNRQPVPTKSVATFASNILLNSKYFPYIVQLIIAGLDWFGTLSEEKFVSTGSGSPYALGVLEAILKKNPTVSEALPVIARAVKAAIERDPGSGEGIDVIALTKEGIRELTDQEILKYLE
jgi:proteasome beta subunit